MKKHLIILEPLNMNYRKRAVALQHEVETRNPKCTTQLISQNNKKFYELIKEHSLAASPAFLLFSDQDEPRLLSTYIGLTSYTILAGALGLETSEIPTHVGASCSIDRAIEGACNS